MKLTATDTLGLTSSINVRLTIVPHLLMTKAPLRQATVGKKYSVRLLHTGGARPFSFALRGGRPGLFPKGLKLNVRTGVISGTPKQAGVFRLRLQVSDALGAHSALGFALKVNG